VATTRTLPGNRHQAETAQSPMVPSATPMPARQLSSRPGGLDPYSLSPLVPRSEDVEYQFSELFELHAAPAPAG
jgi:hypothetical protein